MIIFGVSENSLSGQLILYEGFLKFLNQHFSSMKPFLNKATN